MKATKKHATMRVAACYIHDSGLVVGSANCSPMPPGCSKEAA